MGSRDSIRGESPGGRGDIALDQPRERSFLRRPLPRQRGPGPEGAQATSAGAGLSKVQSVDQWMRLECGVCGRVVAHVLPNSDITGRMGPRDFAERALRNIGPVAVSLRLDVGIPDHLAPLLGVVDNELAKLGGRGCIGL